MKRENALDSAADSLVGFWWSHLPALAGRISRTLSLALSDGIYLAAWSRLAAVAPIVPLLLGIAAGWHRFGADLVFTEAVLILSLAVLFGFLSTTMGALFVLGYAVADFFLYAHPLLAGGGFGGELRVRVALLITYAALAVIGCVLPLTTQLLRASTPMPPREMPDLRLLVDAAFSGAAAGFLVFVYLQALPLLVRPVFTWRGRSPPVGAISTVQQEEWIIVAVAVAAVVVRVVLEYAAVASDPEGLEELADSLEAEDRPGFFDRLPVVARITVASGAATLFFAGMLDTWGSAAILFVGLCAASAVRQVGGAPASTWRRLLDRIPAAVRLAAVFAAVHFFSTRVLANVSLGRGFQPLLWSLLIALLIVAVAFPGAPEDHARPQEEEP